MSHAPTTESATTADAIATSQPPQQTPLTIPSLSPLPAQAPSMAQDIEMTDAQGSSAPASPAVVQGANTPISAPARVGTPSRNQNGDNSRAASLHPEPSVIPKVATPNGAPIRQYINGKVTGPLMEGMKMIAKEQPQDPLRVLGEYLLQKSREIEGT